MYKKHTRFSTIHCIRRDHFQMLWDIHFIGILWIIHATKIAYMSSFQLCKEIANHKTLSGIYFLAYEKLHFANQNHDEITNVIHILYINKNCTSDFFICCMKFMSRGLSFRICYNSQAIAILQAPVCVFNLLTKLENLINNQ